MDGKCEFTGFPEDAGNGCHERGAWLVAVGTRKFDAQLACDRHLGPTCEVLAEAELPRSVTLAVTRARP